MPPTMGSSPARCSALGSCAFVPIGRRQGVAEDAAHAHGDHYRAARKIEEPDAEAKAFGKRRVDRRGYSPSQLRDGAPDGEEASLAEGRGEIGPEHLHGAADGARARLHED